jgi:hypothetical protein
MNIVSHNLIVMKVSEGLKEGMKERLMTIEQTSGRH